MLLKYHRKRLTQAMPSSVPEIINVVGDFIDANLTLMQSI